MTDKELKHLSRKELLELLISCEKENGRLRTALQDAKARLNDDTIQKENAGSLAEAALAMNGVYEAADAAARQYLENIRRREAEAEQERERILSEARAEAERITAEAEQLRKEKIRETNLYVRKVNEKLQDFFKEHPEAKQYVTGGTEAKSE